MQSFKMTLAQAKRLLMLLSAFFTVIIYSLLASPSVYASPTWTHVPKGPAGPGGSGPGFFGVYAMQNLSGTLYVGTMNGVQKFSNGHWVQLGPSNTVSYMTAMNGMLYVTAGGKGVYKYTGGSWSPVGGSTNKLSSMHVQGLANMNGIVYGGTFFGKVYGFENGSWHLVGNTLSGSITDLYVMNGTLYAGTGGIGVYKYDAAAGKWTPVGSTLASAYIDSMTSLNGVLYVGTDGNGVFAFTKSGWKRIGKTAHLSGKMGDSTDRVGALQDINGVLYAGTYSENVYKYVGGSWSQVGNSLGSGFGSDFGITSLLVVNTFAGGNTLYASDGSSGVYAMAVQPPIALNLNHKNVTQTGWYEYWPRVPGAATYDLYIDGKLAASGLTNPDYQITGKKPSTTYQVQVTALNSVGASLKSAADTVTTLPPKPSAPLNLNHKNVTQTGWYEYWPAVKGASTYNLYIDGKQVATGLKNPNDTVTGQQPNTTYQVQVTAVNKGGESIKSASDTVTTLPAIPSAPLNLHHKNVTQTGWYEYWPAVKGASTYNLYIDGKEVAAGLRDPNYTVTGKQPDTTYQVQVTAVNTSGESVKSARDTVTTLKNQKVVPAATKPVTGFPALPWAVGGLLSVTVGGWILWRRRESR